MGPGWPQLQLQTFGHSTCCGAPSKAQSSFYCCCVQVIPTAKQHIGQTWFPHELLAQLQNQMQQKAVAGTELERQLKLLQAALQMHLKDVLNPNVSTRVGKQTMHDVKSEDLPMNDF